MERFRLAKNTFCNDLVEMGQVPARAVEEEAHNLMEQGVNWEAFRIFTNRAEKTINAWQNIHAAKISGKQIEPGTSCQTVIRGRHLVDETRTVALFPRHSAIHHMGETFSVFSG